MRALIVESESRPAAMLPLVDRPFIQHVVETLVELGVRDFDFLLSQDLAGQIRECLGDGTRWGSAFRFHPAGAPSLHIDQPGWLARAGLLPTLGEDPLRSIRTDSENLTFSWRDPSTRQERWTGWGWFQPEMATSLLTTLSQDEDIPCLPDTETTTVEVPALLSFRSGHGVLAAQRHILEAQDGNSRIRAAQKKKGVWVARNATIHRTADLIPPVYVGENSHIRAGVRLGPHAIVASDCIVGNHTSIEDALVVSGSYVGEHLELNRVIVDGNVLLDVDLDTAVTLTDDFILGSLTANRSH